MSAAEQARTRIYTIGHSTRTFWDFLSVLRQHDIRCIVDVRRFPSSKKFPHFNRGGLERSLPENEIKYLWIESLGGRRHGQPAPDSPNAGLRSPAFRNYADYMQTERFREAINVLAAMAKTCPTAIMCAGKLYFRCHRMLISDYLMMLGMEVLHVGTSDSPSADRPILHTYTSCAKVRGGILTYPAS